MVLLIIIQFIFKIQFGFRMFSGIANLVTEIYFSISHDDNVAAAIGDSKVFFQYLKIFRSSIIHVQQLPFCRSLLRET